MKWLLAFLLLNNGLSYSQSTDSGKIIIPVEDDSSLYYNIQLVLSDRGYTIESDNYHERKLRTKKHNLDDGTIIKVYVQIKNQTIVFSGIYIPSTILTSKSNHPKSTGKQFRDIHFENCQGCPAKTAWNELMEIARQFGNEPSIK